MPFLINRQVARKTNAQNTIPNDYCCAQAARQGTGQSKAQRRQKPHGVAHTCVQSYLAKQYEMFPTWGRVSEQAALIIEISR